MIIDFNKPYKALFGGYYEYERPDTPTYSAFVEPPKLPVLAQAETKNWTQYQGPFLLTHQRDDHDREGKHPISAQKSVSEMSVDELQKAKKEAGWMSRNIGGVFADGKAKATSRMQPHHVVQSLIGMANPAIGFATNVINKMAELHEEEIINELEKRGVIDKKNLGKKGLRPEGIFARPQAQQGRDGRDRDKMSKGKHESRPSMGWDRSGLNSQSFSSTRSYGGGGGSDRGERFSDSRASDRSWSRDDSRSDSSGRSGYDRGSSSKGKSSKW